MNQEIQNQIASLLQKNRESDPTNQPIIVLLEHDNDGNIHQALCFGKTPEEEEKAFQRAEGILEDYVKEADSEELEDAGSLEEAKAELRKNKSWKGFSGAVTLFNF